MGLDGEPGFPVFISKDSEDHILKEAISVRSLVHSRVTSFYEVYSHDNRGRNRNRRGTRIEYNPPLSLKQTVKARSLPMNLLVSVAYCRPASLSPKAASKMNKMVNNPVASNSLSISEAKLYSQRFLNTLHEGQLQCWEQREE